MVNGTKNFEYLISEEFLGKINSLINDIIFYDNEKDAINLINTLLLLFKQNPELEKSYPRINIYFNKIIIRASFIALASLKKEEILDLLENNYIEIYNLDNYNLEVKIKRFLMKEADLKVRDEIKLEFRNALLKCQNIISSRNIIINDIANKPTVANWLRDYNSSIGSQKVEKLQLVQYLTTNINTKTLDDSEKNKLKILFNFYERLKISSTLPEGLEESFTAILPDGSINLVYNGKLQKVKPEIIKIINENRNIDKNKEFFKVTDKSTLEKMAIEEEIGEEKEIEDLKIQASRFQPGSLERKAIEEEISRLNR